MQAKTTMTLAELEQYIREIPKKSVRDDTKEVKQPIEIQQRKTWPLGIVGLSHGILR